jgi:hypothetical protein
MAKFDEDLIEMSEQELAFEMIELTCEEMDSLTRAMLMISEMCDELKEEIAKESLPVSDIEIN